MSSFQKMAEQIKETKENELRNKDYKSGEKEESYKMEIVPRSTFLICMIHAMGLWGIHLIHTEVIKSEVKSISKGTIQFISTFITSLWCKVMFILLIFVF